MLESAEKKMDLRHREAYTDCEEKKERKWQESGQK